MMKTRLSGSIWLPCLMALTRASSRASLMAKISCSENDDAWSASSIKPWTRRASARSLEIDSSVALMEFQTQGTAGRRATGARRGRELPHAKREHRSERLQPGLLVRGNGQDFVQLGDLEHVEDVFGNLAKHELTLHRLQLAVQCDEFAQRGAGHELDVPEVQQDLPTAEFVNQSEQVVADHLDVLFVENLLIDEVDDRDIPDVFDFKPATAGLLGRHDAP